MDKYTIDQLCERTGLSRRTIRFYVQEEIIAPPAGRGRGGFYNDTHLGRLVKIRALQEKGLTLTAIATLLGGEQGKTDAHYRIVERQADAPLTGRQVFALYEVSPGITIHVTREAEEAGGKLVRKIVSCARALAKGDSSPSPF